MNDVRPGSNRKLRGPRSRAEGSAWVPVWQGESEAAATVTSGALTAQGVRARVAGVGGYPGGFGAMETGIWTVLCREAEADRARALLRRTGDTGVTEGTPEGISPDWRMTLGAGVLFAAAMALLGLYARFLR